MKKGDKVLFLFGGLLATAILLAVWTAKNEIASKETSNEISNEVEVSNTVGNRELPIYCVDTNEPKVALSFDAAWGNEDTKDILAILEKHQVKVTFFMTGGWIESFPEDVKAIAKAGHDLGNHSENHKNMSQLSDEDKKLELQKAHDKVFDLTGVSMNLFRPPYGDYDNNVITVAKDTGYYTIQWSLDSLDYKNYGREDIIDRVCNSEKLQNGAIILMHNGAKFTSSALEDVITGIKEKGFVIVPVSKLIYTDNYYLDHTGKQFQN